MNIRLLLLVCLLANLLPAPARACLWDRDTIETEVKGLPDVVNVIAGRFERNPDLFYEMRLRRVADAVKQSPHNLELYDDAGVAADHLKRGGEAVAWMEKKSAVMDGLRGQIDEKQWREHRYRYLANLGTFISHRWVREGGDRKRIDQLQRARRLIAQAIHLNPDAHFGREKYQLMVMDWLIEPPNPHKDFLPSALDRQLEEQEGNSTPETVQAISGIIVLGDAWQNVDLFHALSKAVQHTGERNGIAYLASLRAQELAKKDKRSLLPDAPHGTELALLIGDDPDGPRWRLQNEGQGFTSLYKKIRAQADDWHKQRTAYMMERLQQGSHPDTDSAFWNDWQEPAPLDITMPPTQSEMIKSAADVIAIAIGGLIISLIIGIFVWRVRKRKAPQ